MLPLEIFMMDKYLSFEAINKVCSQIMTAKGQLLHGVLVGTKILAVTFLLLTWYKQYWDAVKDRKPGISLHDIGRGVAYILLVVSFSQIVTFMDRGLAEYADSFRLDTSGQAYAAYNQDWLEGEMSEGNTGGGFVDSVVQVATDVGKIAQTVSDPFWWLLYLLKSLAWLVSILITPVFLLERGFLLLLMKLLCPLVLALGALEKYRPLVRKWILTYCAVFLTGLGFALASEFCDEAFRHLVNNFGLADAHDSQIIIFLVIVMAKIKLYKAAITISYRVFNA